MKISQKQASLLAEKVLEKLKKLGLGKLTAAKSEEIRKFVDKRAKFLGNIKQANEALNEYDKGLIRLLGEDAYYIKGCTHKQIVEKQEFHLLPKLRVIENEIILGSMFDKGEDLEAFLDKVVNKFK